MKTAMSHLLILFLGVFIFSCATRVGPLPPHLPPENLPQIDGKKPSSSMEKPRPAIVATMIGKAKKQLGQNRPKEAFQTLERALALDGRDPMIWHLMARARQIQGQYGQAESLARKSNTLAVGDPFLMEKNQKIIAAAKENQVPVQ